MPLQVAQCPRCRGPLVYGEIACRACGQTFQYGPNPPPPPTFAQIVEALAAVGVVVQQAPKQQESLINRGRFETPKDVEQHEVPGFIETAMFKSFTPKNVDVRAVDGLDSGRFAEVGEVAPAFTPGLENGTPEVGDVFSMPVSGLFGSDIFRTDAKPVSQPVEGFEPSTSTPRKTSTAPALGLSSFAIVVCRCGETHRLRRCPSCGTQHPDDK